MQRKEGQSASSAHFSNELLSRPCQRPAEANYHLRPVALMEKADSVFDGDIPAWRKMFKPPVDKAKDENVFFFLLATVEVD